MKYDIEHLQIKNNLFIKLIKKESVSRESSNLEFGKQSFNLIQLVLLI